MARFWWSSSSTETRLVREPMVTVAMESMPSVRTTDAITFSEYVLDNKNGNSIIFIFPGEVL